MLKGRIGESYLGLLPEMIDLWVEILDVFLCFLGLCKTTTARFIGLKLENQDFVPCRAAILYVNWMTLLIPWGLAQASLDQVGLSVGNRSDFQTPSSQTCRPQSKPRWISIPLTSQRSLCIMLAAAATTAAYRKFTTLAVRHRKLFCAWNAIFAARWVRLACAAAAVHSDVSNSRHVAKHRVNSAAVWRDPLCHQMMKCLAWSTCASWTASPESDAAWGLVTWSARRCHGARNLLTRFSTSNLNFCMQWFSSLWSKAHFGDSKPQGF